MNIALRSPSPVALRGHVAQWLRVLAAWLTQMADRLSPQKRAHRGAPPLIGSGGITIPMEIAVILGRTKAVILQKIREWEAVNERNGTTFLDGYRWTYMSYAQMQRDHFPDRHPDTIRKNIRSLEKDGLLISCQPDPTEEKWYRVDMKAVNALISGVGVMPSPVGKASSRAGITPTKESKVPTPITSKTNKSNGKSKPQAKPKQQQQPGHNNADAAASTLPIPDPEPESGEHRIDGEVPSSVKASHRDGANDDPIPHSAAPLSQNGELSESVAALLNDMQATYGPDLTFGHALNLIREHGEDLVRGVHWYVTSPAKWDDWRSPAAALTGMLRKNKTGIQPRRADEVNPWTRDERAQEDEFDWEAEELARLEAREHIQPLPEPVGLDEKPGGSMTVREIWNTALNQYSLLFDRPSYDMWLKQSHIIGYETTTATLRIGVPTAHAQDMLQNRYYRKVQRTVEGLTTAPVKLVFEVSPPLQPEQRPLSASERDALHRLRETRALI